MNVYESFGIKTVINLWGTATQLGGSLMAPQALDAMRDAAQACAKPEDIQAAATRFLSQLTGAEAGYITCGAASGVMLAAAACLARLDLRRMEQLPDTTGMPNEVLIARDQRSGWDHAIRAVGAKMVDVGVNESLIGSVRPIELWDYESAITPKTAAIAYIAYTWDARKEQEITALAKLAHKYNLPLMVDAAASAPPLENFRKIMATGADIVAFSGGKALRGPQNAGILLGRKDLIASVALQHLDMVGTYSGWNPPADLIPPGCVPCQPRQGIGRPLKVSKETAMGLLVRLRYLAEHGQDDELAAMDARLVRLQAMLADVPHISIALKNRSHEGKGGTPTMNIQIDAERLGVDACEICRRLTSGSPRIYVNEKSVSHNVLVVTATSLPDELVETVGQRLREVMTQH